MKLEAEVIDNVAFGWFLLRLNKGARIRTEQSFINNELWVPRFVQIGGAARVAGIKKLNREIEIQFRNYGRFQTDSRILSSSEIPPGKTP